jgi:class 3 adenylate cyclase
MDAWMLIQTQRPQVILLDTKLPDGSGFELCQQLKRSPQIRRIPVLFWGEAANVAARLRSFEVGGVDFIPKPYFAAEVMARINLHVVTAQTHRRMQHHAQQTWSQPNHFPLLANLQRTLHQQAVKLQAQNIQLQNEIHERHEVERALRQEQQKSEQLLLNILPEAIVTQLKQFQGSLAERFEEATVLFADIVNFTPLAAQCSPLELVNLLNQIFSAFDRLAEKYHLEKIKTIGDAYMVVGGVPVIHESHAAAVADMALEMQTVIQNFRREGQRPIQLRIGINTGTVVAGVIGIKKFSYDLWGDTVNVASRMESQGTPGKIQVTETTYQQLASAFQFESGQEIEVKGKGRMKTYYLLGRR